ncbi:hypothetical protein [Niabella sp.]|uniref:hypothetical protein n=1 Tax=Niabella sp. TaxID=1962976 RepID=UPI0026236EBF|nr:hypothetical protein [Niabella sp.]
MFALILLCSFSMQLLHQHHYENKVMLEKKEALVKMIADHCKICDQIQHGVSYDGSVPDIQIATPIAAIPVHGGRYYIGFYKFTLQGFTNKGPPAAMATAIV